jgi:sulfur relay (sulfurtransferase) complex TusBCD TusD component (DsrE family)
MIAVLTNASPYGSELPYNALRVAAALELDGQQVEVLLMGDAVNTARRGQDPRAVHAPLEPMLAELVEKGAGVTLCGTCCQTRGLREEDLVEHVTVGTIHDFARVITASDKVVSF